MSADLVLRAAPPDPAWLKRFRWREDADYTTSAWDPEEEYRDGDGYIRRRITAETTEVPSHSWRGITFEDYETVTSELGLNEFEEPYVDFCWIGQVSWMKAGLFGDDERYVPAAVRRVHDLAATAPIITRTLVTQIMDAMNAPNRSIYGRRHYRYGKSSEKLSSRRVRHLGAGIHLETKPEHNAVYSGLARPRVVKRWLLGHLGARVVSESW